MEKSVLIVSSSESISGIILAVLELLIEEDLECFVEVVPHRMKVKCPLMCELFCKLALVCA